ncbi:MAG: hypothetical protein HY821_05990 [Acidobacteria bacterium]|nr:hypothetical protein [Acidobacteriota bacterium]
MDPFWQAAHEQANKPHGKASNVLVAGLVTGLLGAMVLARIVFPDAMPDAGGASPLVRAVPTVRPNQGADKDQALPGQADGISGWLEKHLPGEKPVTAKWDAGKSDGDWTGTAVGWLKRDGMMQPGKLRLWKPTLNSKDYEMEFEAAIQKRGVSWVYRAQDSKSYYATKILLGRGEAGGSTILRYGLDNNREFARVELPLPAMLQAKKNYRIAMMAVGDHFTTLIDGRVVDEWTDGRLKKGGVGFFSDEGESAGIQWANFRERKGVLSGLFTAALILPPGVSY